MGDDLFAANTFRNPENMIPTIVNLSDVNIDEVTVILPKLFWHMLRFKSS